MNYYRNFVFAFLLLWLACSGEIAAQSRLPLVTVLTMGSESATRSRVDSLQDGLRELGYVEGKNYRLESRWANNEAARLPGLARELLTMKPDVAVGIPVMGAQAFFNETKTVPIVMAGGAGAMLGTGMIASLAHPGGNVTGVMNQGDELTQKLFELLRDIAPNAKRVAAISSGPSLVEADVRERARVAAKAFGLSLIEINVTSASEARQLKKKCVDLGCEAMVILLNPYLQEWRVDITGAAAVLRIPAIYPIPEYSEAGGLFSYSANAQQQYRRAAFFVDKILKGAKPADLPVEQPTKFDLIINMKAAKALGLKIPQSVLIRADRVIE
jgi:putative ABC transport system substrate-binding protein